MGTRYEVEVTITSARDLKNVNWRHGNLIPYVVAWLDPAAKCSTRTDHDGGTSPRWDDTLLIPLNSPVDESTLHLDVVHADDAKPIVGSARLPLRDVLDDVGLGVPAVRWLQLRRPSGRPQGEVEVRVAVRELHRTAPDPYYAPPYGLPPPGTRNYPQYGSPYGAPPPTYAAPPAGYPAAYGAPPPIYGQQQQGGYYGEEKKKSKFGGMGTGLAVGAIAGALGGVALAEGVDALEDEIADDVADRVEDDLGYDGDDF